MSIPKPGSPTRWHGSRTTRSPGSTTCSHGAGPDSGEAGRLLDIDHSRTKTKSPRTNGIVERFHKTVLDEFYRVAFRKRVYGSVAELQADLDTWIGTCNEEREHQGRWCFGKTPMRTFLDAAPIAREKMIAA